MPGHTHTTKMAVSETYTLQIELWPGASINSPPPSVVRCLCRVCIVRIQPRNHVLDHTWYQVRRWIVLPFVLKMFHPPAHFGKNYACRPAT